MTISLDPILVSFGPLAIRWLGLLAVLGVVLGVWGTLRALDRVALPRKPVLDALAWAIPAGVIGARVVHVLGFWDYYFTHGDALWRLSIEGMSLWGGLVAGGAAALARLHRRRVPPPGKLLDVAAPYVALGIAFGRFGAFIDGLGQGVPAGVPWATTYTNALAETPDFGVPRHPAQAYDAVLALGLGLVLGRVPLRGPTGLRVALFCAIYGLARIGLGGLRTDPAFLFGLQIEELLALPVAAIGVLMLLRLGAAGLVGRRRREMVAAAGGVGEARPREDSMAA
jgi:phosphatidylglycerol:prolipoprotein diacylglycerol transferase